MYSCFVKQDGIYNTLALLITDEALEPECELPTQWYFAYANQDLAKCLIQLYNIYWKHTSSFSGPIVMELEDKYIITEDIFKDMFPELFI